MDWAIRDPARFIQERDGLSLLSEEGWLTCEWHISRGGDVEVTIDIRVHNRVYEGSLTYPALFPNSLPYIRPRNSSELWSGHQYGPGGALCLEWRPDNWHPQVTGAEVVRSAYRLLSLEQDPETPVVVPSAHRLTIGQENRLKVARFVTTPELLVALTQIPENASTVIATLTIAHQDLTVRFASHVSRDGTLVPIGDLPKGISEFVPLCSWSGSGWAFRSPMFASINVLRSSQELVTSIEAAGLDASPVTNCLLETRAAIAPLVLLLSDDPRKTHVYSLEMGEPRILTHHAVFHGSHNETRLPAQADMIAGKRFGIVGLGSLGSKIAVSLARSGVRNFLLVDDDLLLPENVSRHELSWAAVGAHKVDGVRDALQLVAPQMNIVTRMHRLAGQESPISTAAVLQDLSRCDVILDATANPEVFLILAAVARSAHKPLIWAEVFAGGFGGLIARARPSLDPNPLAVRDSLHGFLATRPDAPFRNATGYDVDGDAPHRAFDSDVTYVAAAATRLTLDTVSQPTSSEFPFSVYLLGMRREWIFEQPFDTLPVEVSGDGWDDEPLAATPEVQQKALADLLSILKVDRC